MCSSLGEFISPRPPFLTSKTSWTSFKDAKSSYTLFSNVATSSLDLDLVLLDFPAPASATCYAATSSSRAISN
ncbi:hypothetical protein V6N13_030723 [Hibiscus sabdariffa]|uniref:Uncharacterized protein n=1 Tax=Hibiscus sabdariffa TaxID=183260 RepID=A0ABR2D624_9ROSI